GTFNHRIPMLRCDGRVGTDAETHGDIPLLTRKFMVCRPRCESGDGNGRMRPLIWTQVIAEVVEPRAWHSHRPELSVDVACALAPKPRHDFECLESHTTIHAARGLQPEELMVAGQGTDPDPQPVASFRKVVEISHPMGQFDRVVVWQEVTERPKVNPLGPLECLRDEQV